MKKMSFLFIILIFITLLGCQTTEENVLNKILDTIEIPSEVTSNLDLQTTYSLGDVEAQAKWETTASSVITSEGIITIGVVDQTATLILTLSIGDNTLKKHYNIIVKGSDDHLLLFALVQNQLKFSNFDLESDLDLQTTYIQNNKTINALWVSSNEGVLDNTGKITRLQTDIKVTLSVTLSINSVIREETFEFTVLRDPAVLPVNWWHTVDVWTNTIPGESIKPAVPVCYPGALYRKVVSSDDYWLGIEALLTIPEFIPDEERFDVTRPSYYLDNSSIYLGGNAMYESDIGLAWKIGHADSNSTAITKSGVAFRPFWRYITRKESCPNNNCYRNSNVNDYEYYYFPGDKIRISVFSPEGGYLQMRIELLELTTNPLYVAMRAKYNLGENFNRIFTTDKFPSEGMGVTKAEFKRVNAIDQVSNEGKQTINTNSKVNNAIWHEVYLYRNIENNLYKVPLTEDRSAGMICPLGSNINGNFTNAIKISYTNVNKALGGEVITLDPNNGTGKLYNLVAIIVPNPYKDYL